MSVRVLSSDHFGVAQKRRRSVFIGNKLGLENIFPKPTHANEPIIIKEAFLDMTFDGIKYNHDIKTAQIRNELEKKRIKKIPEGKSIRYKKDEIAHLPPKLRFDVNWDTIEEGRFREKRLNRLDRNKVSPTIMTSRYTYYHPTQSRYLTAREAASIQSFPNDFIFEGTISQQWIQIGNAVPPLLGKAIGGAILETYKKKKKAKLASYATVEELIAVVRAHAFDYKKNRIRKKERYYKFLLIMI